jgi:hypothetical protein
MAISDVLSEAANDIRDMLLNRPEPYADLKPRLEKLVSEMDSIRIELDAPPNPTPRD